MIINRKINGESVEIELTPGELEMAFRAKEAEYRMQDVKEYISTRRDDAEEDGEAFTEPTEEQINEMFSRYCGNLDKRGSDDWQYAVEDAYFDVMEGGK